MIPAEWTLVREGWEDATVPGTLEISPDHPTHTIRLHKEFPDVSEADVFAAIFLGKSKRETYPILYGETLEGLFTAIDSTIVHRQHGSGISDVKLIPSFVLHGHFSEEELFITEATVRFWDMDHWATFESFSIEPLENASEGVTITQHRIPESTAEYKGATVTLEDSARQTFSGLGRITLLQRAQFKLKFPNSIPLRAFIGEWLKPLQFWVSTGTRRTTGVEYLYIHNREWKDPAIPEEPFPPTQMIPRNPKRNYDAEDHPSMLHHLRDFDYQKQLPVVFDTYFAHGFVIDQFLDFIHQPSIRPLTAFTSLASFTEAFDRSLNPDPEPSPEVKDHAAAIMELATENLDHPELGQYARDLSRAVLQAHWATLASRLSRLDKQSGSFVSTTLGDKSWKTRVPDVRNAVIHGLPSADFFKKNMIPIQVGRDILRMLFEVRLLVALGFTTHKAGKIMSENPRFFRQKHLITDYLDVFEAFAEANKPVVLEQGEDAAGQTPTNNAKA
ncbi:hypothetical protein ASF79_14240 [Agreia sp. Leaf335]|nr:hypothetical protein ASF79_14240 [Agreia sp. Leaf335]